MKIGILTYHWVANFGANLQALSTYNYYKKNGHNPIVINWIPSDLESYYLKSTNYDQFEIHKKFAIEHFNTTDICRNEIAIASEINKHKIDAVIIGSDAVLTYKPFIERIYFTKRGVLYIKPAIDSDFPNPYWGCFSELVPNIPLALMSASAQNTNFKKVISKKQKNNFKQALEKFSFISVRDIWTKDMISYFTKNAIVPIITPDPVFAFNNNHSDYLKREEVLIKYNLPEKYILFTLNPSMFTNQWVNQIELLFENYGIKCFELPKPQGHLGININNKIPYPLSPIDWYYLIKYSSGYVGELMHPLLVSLHNSVPFFSVDNYGFHENGKLLEESSKILQIILKFEMRDNYYSVFHKNEFPSANKVFNSIITFDKLKCKKVSDELYSDYEDMMKRISDSCLLIKK